MRKFFGWLIALPLLLVALQAGAAETVLSGIKAGGKLVIGYRESSVPFSYVNEGKPIGYALDLCLKVADAVRRKTGMKAMPIEFVMVTSADRLAMVEQGKVHLECGSTTNNAERREKVAFTIPHFITGARLLVKASAGIRDIEDMGGKKLVSTKGSTPLKAAEKANRERLLRMTILEAPDHARAMDMIEKGEADAFVMDDVLLFGLIANRPAGTPLKVTGKFLSTEPLAIMLPKGEPEFKKLVDDELRRLILSGDIQPIYDKWFNKPIPPRNTALAMPASHMLKNFWKYPTDYVPF